MVSNQQIRKKRIVQFYNANIDHGKKCTVDHFFAEGISERIVYHILKKEVVDRATGTGRKSTIMTVRTLCNICRKFNKADGLSQRESAKKYGCMQSYISKCLLLNVTKKRKSPGYTEDQISSVKSQYRWMARKYAG